MRAAWKVVLALLLGLPALAGAQPCNSTQGQLEICKGITTAVRWGFPRYTTAQLPACTTANKGAGAFNTTTGTVQVCSGSAWGDVGPAGSGITSLNGLVAGTQLFAAPAAGLTITSLTDTHTFALANDLAALEGLSTTGVAVRTGTSTWTTRTITGTANQIAVADGDGVAGAPTLSISPVLDLTSKTLRVPNSTTLPATCTVGDSYMDTDATTGARWYLCESTDTWVVQGTGGGGGAPTDATYITQTANGSLSAEQALGALATGCLGSATTTGVVSARTVTGTSNEVSVANGDCSGNPTISLPATIDLGGKTSFEVPNGASPTTDAFGEIAGDNDAWAASRGALQFFDGTANTYLVGTLASDTPINGQVPTWNTGGTVTWETTSAGGITIGDTQVAYATAANTVGGEAGMTYASASNALALGVADTDGGSLTVNATLGTELMPALSGASGVNWTFGAGWATPLSSSADKNAGGTGTLTPTGATAIVAGSLYKVVITLSACSVCTSGSVGATYTLGGVAGNNYLSSTATFTDYIVASTTGNLIITPTSSSRFTISAISVKAVTLGNVSPVSLSVGGVASFGSSTVPGTLEFPANTNRGAVFNSRATVGNYAFSFQVPDADWGSNDKIFCINDSVAPNCTMFYVNGQGSISTAGTITATSSISGSAYASGSTGTFAWTSRGILSSPAAGNVQLGNANAASPVSQTLSTQGSRGGTDTDTAGGSLTVVSGIGTGNSVPAILMLQAGGLTPTSGTTAQSARTRLGLGASKVLTNNSAITILSATEAATSATVGGIGGRIDYCIEVVDATDAQQECGNVTWQGVNKAGAFTNSVTEVSTQVVSAGTLATTWAISSANPALISINANSSLTPSTGFPRITYNFSNLSQQAVAIQ